MNVCGITEERFGKVTTHRTDRLRLGIVTYARWFDGDETKPVKLMAGRESGRMGAFSGGAEASGLAQLL
jgi:hypothetical protein